jgi:hypothetical protein
MSEGKSISGQTIRRRAPLASSDDNATAEAVVTFSCMLTVPGGAPTISATLLPTRPGSSHQVSSQARMPRVAQISAYSARPRAALRGIAPRELLIM